MRILFAAGAMAAALYGSLSVAQKPVEDISAKCHPNITAAKQLTQYAWKISAAQSAHEFDLDRHAGRKSKIFGIRPIAN